MNLIKFILIFLSFSTASAQNLIIKGTVQSAIDKTPLANAVVQLGTEKITTNSKGQFLFTKINRGNQLFLVTHQEYKQYQKSLDIQADVSLVISLEQQVAAIEIITLHRSSKNSGRHWESRISQIEIERNSTENLGNLLTELSGVTALKTGNNISKPIINGLYGDRVSIVANGIKLVDQEWGIEHAPTIDANNFDRINVVKGASTLKYGMISTNGVVVLEPEILPKKDTLTGLATLSGMSNGKGITAQLSMVKTWGNHWGIKSRGAYTKMGDLSTPDYGLMNTGMEQHSFGFSLQNSSYPQGFSLDYYGTQQKIGIYRGTDLGNLNDYYTAITSEKPIYFRDFSYHIDNPNQEILHQMLKISAYKRLENWGKLSVEYNLQYNRRKEFDIRRADLYHIPAMELELWTNQLNINYLLEREKWSIESGIQGQYQYNYSPVSTQAKRLIPNYNQYNFGFFSILKQQIAPQLKYELGIRGDYQKNEVKAWFDAKEWNDNYQNQFSNFYIETVGNRIFTTPLLEHSNLGINVGIDWEFAREQQLKINYSNTQRTPNIAELFSNGLHHSAAIIEQGDMRLKTENSQQINGILSLKLDFLGKINLTINPFVSSIRNFITQIPTGVQNTIRGVFPVWTYQQVDVKMYGTSVDYDWEFNHWIKWNSKFSYLNGQDVSNDQPMPLLMPSQWSNALELKVPWKKSFVRAEHIWVMHQHKFPINNPSIMIFENGVEVEKTLDLSTPPPAYQLWNVYAELELVKNLSFSIKVTNLANTSYKNYLNRLRYFSNEMGRNCTLSLRLKF